MKYILIVASLFIGSANATFYPQIKWITPVEREDGTTITNEEIKEYRIYKKDGTNYILVWAYNMVPELQDSYYTLVDSTDVSTCYVVTTVDTEDRESDYSQEACYSIPNPPQVECVIY